MANTYTLIEAKTLSTTTASVTFSSIPSGYTDILVKVSSRSADSGTDIAIRFNGDTGNNYTFIRLYANGSTVSTSASTTTRLINNMMVQASYTANVFGNGEIYIPNYTSSNYKSVSIDGVTENNDTTSFQAFTAGLWSSTSAINSITLISDGGNIASGSTFYLYGISNS
ncbi:MAG: hypothetical protein WCG15_05410 [Actinomycetes bacterium]